MVAEFTAFVEHGVLPDGIRKDIGRYIAGYEGKKVRVTIKEAKAKRSNKQNSYYFGVVIPAVKAFFVENGNSVDDEMVHNYLKQEVGKLKQVVMINDDPSIMIKSTAKLSTIDFEDYLTKIRAWGAAFGLIMAFPNEELEYEPK